MQLAIFSMFVVVACSSGGAGGYDHTSSCARPYRSSRARPVPDLPCDFNKQIYCSLPGTSYPWQAIRNYIRENQGLMKRMYGEERHVTVLKAELENFIEEDDIDEIKKTRNYEDNFIKTSLLYAKKSQGRAMNGKPHFRPIQEKNKKNNNDTLLVKPLEIVKNSSASVSNKNDNKTEVTNNETLNEDKDISYKTKLESIANIEINDLEPNVITLEAVIKQNVETNRIYPKYTVSSKKETLKSANENTTDKNGTATSGYIETKETTTQENVDDITTLSNNADGWKAMQPDTSTLPPTLLFSVHEKIDRIDTNANEKNEENIQKPAPYQDRPSVIKLGGENACETRRTLEAPFWANNTKNELLALVNMYPFEQYIHMETCVHERKQMYCREGCRCEQQYRYHRLLAYDPHNECRGIFADWFKFPVCCVCKCYDVPVEFRARSPRILPPQYDENIKRVIYEDVARDWYSVSYDDHEEF